MLQGNIAQLSTRSGGNCYVITNMVAMGLAILEMLNTEIYANILPNQLQDVLGRLIHTEKS